MLVGLQILNTQSAKKRFTWKTYNPIDYPKYDNYDAINVNRLEDIPKDYDGVMGVPITYLGKYNPNQFEIVGIMRTKGKPLLMEMMVGQNYLNKVKVFMQEF